MTLAEKSLDRVTRAPARALDRHFEATVEVAAERAELFAYLDDLTRLAAHMERPSMMMGGGKMTYAFDEGQGRAVGSHILMGGSAFGVTLSVDEVVTAREPPRRKVWRTVGEPKLLIIGAYEMGFEIHPAPGGADLRVWIDYRLPEAGLARLAGQAFAGMYARWCVERIVGDALAAFER